MDYGSRIRKLRDAKGFTIEELANRARITAGYLGRLERGEEGYDNPTLSTIESIAQALDIHASMILFGTILTPEMVLNPLDAIGVLEEEEKRFILKMRRIPSRQERITIEKVIDAFIRAEACPAKAS